MRGPLEAALGLTLAASAAAAQGSAIDARCAAGSANALATQDACQKAVDVFRFLAPQLGASIAGGNAVLGESAALDGVGHLSIGVRLNALEARLPRVDLLTPALTGAVSSDVRVDRQWLALPVVDAAVGLWSGFALAGSRALAADALVNIAYLPSLRRSRVTVSPPNGGVRMGFGGRLTVLDESIITPAITGQYVRYRLPMVSVMVTAGSDELAVRRVRATTSAWRVVVGKHLAPFEVSLGAGEDRSDAGADVFVRLERGSQVYAAGPLEVSQALTRTSAFADLALNLSQLRIAVEVGRVTGGAIRTLNAFGSDRADDPVAHASLGARVQW
jgi:hypothetical protein